MFSRYVLCGAMILALGVAAGVRGQTIEWGESQLVGGVAPGGIDVAHTDAHIAVTDDVWIGVWRILSGSDNTDGDILYSRSLNKGATWTPPAYLNTDAETDTAVDTFVNIGASAGTFIVVWHRVDDTERGMYAARSTDGGVTWSAPTAIAPAALDVSTSVTPPAVQSDGKGVWVAVGDIDGGLVTVRSVDDGLTWSAPENLIIRERALALPDNQDPTIATDEAGNWRIVWSHFGLLGGSVSDRDIAFSASNDNGATWSAPAVLNDTMNSDSSREAEIDPTVTTDGQGRWVAAWSRVDCCGSSETTPTILQFSRASENGAEWTDSNALLSFHSNGDLAGINSALAADRDGNWVNVFQGLFSSSQVGDIDISFVESTMDASAWSDIGPVNDWAEIDGENGGDSDTMPAIATDGNGTWITVWQSLYSDDLAVRQRIFASSTQFTGRIVGTVESSGAPIPCAAIRIVGTTTDLNIDRVVGVSASGQFTIKNLPEGAYTLTLFAPGFSRNSLTTTVAAGLTTFAAFQPIPVSEGNRIFGMVTDASTGEPLVGVRVEARVNGLPTDTTYTCGSGSYELVNVLTTKGNSTTVSLSFTLENYVVESDTVSIDAGATVEFDATLMKAVGAPASLSGVVVRAGVATGIPGARVTLRGRGRVTAQADNAGLFSFDAVPEGQYTIIASAEGFLAKEVSRAIGLNDASTLTITLDEGALQNPSDINGDGAVNALDIQQLINIVLGLASGDGDVNGDGQINALDIQRVILVVLGIG